MIRFTKEIEATLTTYEKMFFNAESYKIREKLEQEPRQEITCYIKKLDIVLSHYSDIVLLFTMKDGFRRFINYLFQAMLLQTKDGGSTYVYNRPDKDGKQGNFVNYALDYNYILYVLLNWGIRELGAEESNFSRFIAQFSSLNNGIFSKKNYFLIATIFNEIFELNPSQFVFFMKNPKDNYKLDIRYFTPYIVETITEERYYFMGVIIPGSEVLKYLDEGVVLSLFEGRINNNLKVISFSNTNDKYKKDDGKNLEAFWKIAHPLIEKQGKK